MKRLDAGIALSIFVAALAFYIRTLAPSLLHGDSAEFQTIAYTLGIGHPTGYPVYILIAKLFTFLPIGDIAYRVNLLSAVFAALTVSLVYLILRKLGALQIPAALSGFMLAFTDLFWKHASIAEVYAISAACLAFICYSIFTWKESNNPRWLFVAGFFGGLSFGIHTTIALSGIAILLYLLLSTRQKSDWARAVLGALVGVIIFLLAFLLLDYHDASTGYYNVTVRHALSAWGMTPADFDAPFERLAFLYFPPQFSGRFFAAPSALIWEHLKDFFDGVSWNGLIALLGVVSLFVPRKHSAARWREALLLLVAFSAFLFFAASYDVDDYYVFYIPALLFLTLAIGLGFNAIAEITLAAPLIPSFLPNIILGVAMLANLWFSFPHALAVWQSRIPPLTEDYEALLFSTPNLRQVEAERMIKRVEDNAIIFTDWEHAYSFYYVARILQGRTAIDFYESYPQGDFSQIADSTLAFIDANIDARPIYFTEYRSALGNHYRAQRVASGLFRIWRK
jgi:hypothetical protein